MQQQRTVYICRAMICHTWYGDLLWCRCGGAVLVGDSDSDKVGPWTKGYLCTTTDGSGQVGNREGLLTCR